MCRLRSCCFCCSLRTGTYVAAIYTLIITVVTLITTILSLVNLGKTGDDLDNALGSSAVGQKVQGDEGDDSTLGKIVYYTTAILYVFWFISAILIFVGCSKERRGFLLPWLIITIIMIVIAGIALAMSCVDIKEVFDDGSRAVTFVVQVVIFLVSMYALAVVCTFYRNNMREAVVRERSR